MVQLNVNAHLETVLRNSHFIIIFFHSRNKMWVDMQVQTHLKASLIINIFMLMSQGLTFYSYDLTGEKSLFRVWSLFWKWFSQHRSPDNLHWAACVCVLMLCGEAHHCTADIHISVLFTLSYRNAYKSMDLKSQVHTLLFMSLHFYTVDGLTACIV